MALGYATLGFGLLGAVSLGSAGHHLLLIGALGLSIFIVMAVAGRLHSGHGLDYRPWLPVVGLCLLAAALLRSFASVPLVMIPYMTLLNWAAGFWIVAWSGFLLNFWKVLTGPRPDGGQGCDEVQR